jgi:HAMP domain-containing protein
VHAQLGYATYFEYLERTFGYGPRAAHERLRVAQALDDLPELRARLAAGRLNWSTVRELTRVAVPETEVEWAEAAEGWTVREVERAVKGRLPGDRPEDPRREEAATRRLALDVSPETLATFREAVGRLRQETETPITDEEALLEMSRRVLGGTEDAGEASYAVALTVCPSCRKGSQRGRGEIVAVDAAVVEQAQCDARRFEVPSSKPAKPIGAADEPVGRAHVGTGAPSTTPEAKTRARASQTIPPATRRRVMARDHGRCVVPGCRCATYVDLHHLRFRSEGGGHDDDNLVVLCGAHHRATHRGRLRIDGTPSTGLNFQHADGTPYGQPLSPDRTGTRDRNSADAIAALRALGFSGRDADDAVRVARAHVSTGAPWGDLMRAALAAARAET